MRMRDGGMSNPAYYITLLLDIYIYIYVCYALGAWMLFTDVLRKGQQHSELFLSRPAVMKSRSTKSYVYELHSTAQFSLFCARVMSPLEQLRKYLPKRYFLILFLPYYNRNFFFFNYLSPNI
jgi:hypothetical protein